MHVSASQDGSPGLEITVDFEGSNAHGDCGYRGSIKDSNSNWYTIKCI
jgi:hypothetical protein